MGGVFTHITEPGPNKERGAVLVLSHPAAHLGRHVHEEHGGDGGLGLAVALLGPVQRVRLQHPEQVLLPVGTDTDTHTDRQTQ